MNATSPDNKTFSLAIAGIGVLLSSEDGELVDQIRQRYRLFSNHGDYQHRVMLKRVERIEASAAETIEITNSELFISNMAYEGKIDLNGDTSTLLLNSGDPLADIEYFLRIVYALIGVHAGGFLLHSAGVVRFGHTFLFIGPSGSGKSTVAQFSPQDLVLNDDLLMVLPGENQWIAYSTPFWNRGKGFDAGSFSAPMAGIYRLVKDQYAYLETVTRGEAIAELLASIPVAAQLPAIADRLIKRCSAILDTVPLYRLHFLPDDSFWAVIVESRIL